MSYNRCGWIKIITQWWAITDVVTEDGQFFTEYSYCLWSSVRNNVMVVYVVKIILGGKHTRYYKLIKFCQNPRVGPNFLAQNDLGCKAV